VTAAEDVTGLARAGRRISIAPRPADPAADAAELHRKAVQVSRGGARAAVLGVNDGLVTILALVLGMAGAHASASTVRLAGLASLVAGALSMAAGEWVSVTAQVDLYQGVLAELRQLLGRNPKLVLDTLETKLEQCGFDTSTAQRASTELGLDEDLLLAFAAQNLFGVNRDEMGSPIVAATSSLVLFVAGGILPLFPWFFTGGSAAVAWSMVLGSLAAISVGGFVSSSAGSPIWRGALRQLIIVGLAAGFTYGIGRAVGTTIG
jgi:VIT1/CCC1 family predicted Fe2+/Mn2+ transporter